MGRRMPGAVPGRGPHLRVKAFPSGSPWSPGGALCACVGSSSSASQGRATRSVGLAGPLVTGRAGLWVDQCWAAEQDAAVRGGLQQHRPSISLPSRLLLAAI